MKQILAKLMILLLLLSVNIFAAQKAETDILLNEQFTQTNPQIDSHLRVIKYLDTIQIAYLRAILESSGTDSMLNEHFRTANLQAITHLWTMKILDSIQIAYLRAELESSENEIISLSDQNQNLLTDNKILENENEKLWRIIESKDTASPVPIIIDPDNIGEKLFITIDSVRFDSVRLKSSYFSESKFTVTLDKKPDTTGNPPYPFIYFVSGKETNPYFSAHPDMVIKKTEGGGCHWEISYLTKNWIKPFNIEMRLAGYKIEGSKVDIIIETNKEHLLRKVFNYFVWLLTRGEIIFVIILTFITNINKFQDELKSLIFKIKHFNKKTKANK